MNDKTKAGAVSTGAAALDVLYARYSSDNQTENSIAYQREAVLRYCKGHHILIAKEYVDEAYSGTNTLRPAFQQLLTDARSGEISRIFVYDRSRFSRNAADYMSIKDELIRMGVQLISVTEPDVEGASGWLSENISAVINEHFVRQLRERSMQGSMIKARQGQFLGGPPPLGYRIESGQYVIDLHEAEIVRAIFSMYAEYNTLQQIADYLNAKGYSTRYGRPWTANSFSNILRNERYIGVYTWMSRRISYMRKWAGGGKNPNEVRIEDHIPPIIDLQLWDAVQHRNRDNSGNGRAKACRREYPLSGVIECGECGVLMHGHTTGSQKRGYVYAYYDCRNHNRHTCSNKPIKADEVEAVVRDALFSTVLTSQVQEHIAEELYLEYVKFRESAYHDRQAREIAAELQSVERKLEGIYRAIEDGLYSPDLKARVEELTRKREELKNRKVSRVLRPNVTKEAIRDALFGDLDSLSFRRLVQRFIHRVKINQDSVEITVLASPEFLLSGGGATPSPLEYKKILTFQRAAC